MNKLNTLYQHAGEQESPRVLVVAEIGVNHDGYLERALELVHIAAEAGAQAVKTQLFDAAELLSNQAMLADYQKHDADDAFLLLNRLQLSLSELSELREAVKQAGLMFIVTPFSMTDIEKLGQLYPDAVKIASPDAVNLPLIEAAAAFGRPLLISTGTCDLAELDPAAACLRHHPAGGALLQCISSYPTPDRQAGLGGIAAIAERYGLPVGYSDHTTSTITPALAVAAGACIIEKHLTYDTHADGPDHAASLNPTQFKTCVEQIRLAADMLGPIRKNMLPIEAEIKTISRQSLCATRNLAVGHVLTADDLIPKRPGTGIPASQLTTIIGRQLARPVAENDLIQFSQLIPQTM